MVNASRVAGRSLYWAPVFDPTQAVNCSDVGDWLECPLNLHFTNVGAAALRSVFSRKSVKQAALDTKAPHSLTQ